MIYSKRLFFICLSVLLPLLSGAQTKQLSSSEILHELNKLSNTARVLYLAAHPDDENTRLISYFANDRKFETAYLALTRGDGGQNVIGPELREGLGLIRTQELLAARSIDGGRQFFTRANDFGYSKTPSETFNIWDREKVLSDVVWVIRKFRPDVIITRFNETPGTTHGHHTASAILAREAFHLAGDASKYPEQLEYVDTWQPKRLFWNTSSWFYRGNKEFDESKFVSVDVGGYSASLGHSYSEIAALSRSQHKSQAFGSTGTRGEQKEYLEQWEGDIVKNDPFEGLLTDWSRYANGELVNVRIDSIINLFSPQHPEKSVEGLLDLRTLLMDEFPETPRIQEKIESVEQLIAQCAGLYMSFRTTDAYGSPGDSISYEIELTNRSSIDIVFNSFEVDQTDVSIFGKPLDFNQPVVIKSSFPLAKDKETSTPYWLENEGTTGMYTVKDQELIGKPENDPSIVGKASVKIGNATIKYELPLVYRRNDQTKGEVIQPFYVVPPVSIAFNDDIVIFTGKGQQKEITVQIKAFKSIKNGNLSLTVPKNWTINKDQVKIGNMEAGEQQSVSVVVTSGASYGEFSLDASLNEASGKSQSHVIQIQYDHIPDQVIIKEANAKLVNVKLETKGELVGYVMGAGDRVPEAIAAMGYKVEMIDAALVTEEDLLKYDAIVIGIRAYNTNPDLVNNNESFLKYAKEGGTLIVQYNTTYGLRTKDFSPYELTISRDRITDETATLNFLNPSSPLLTYPNELTPKDFSGWVQERGLYFPDEWSKEFTPLLEGHDPEEKNTQGALLYATYGKGLYIYTGLSFFRELPAGVPGAYRLFANLLSAKRKLITK